MVEQVGEPTTSKAGVSLAWRRHVEKIHHFLEWLKGRSNANIRFQQWSQQFADVLSRLGVSVCITLVLEIILLFISHYLWFVFSWTPMGELYRQAAPDRAMIMNLLFNNDLIGQGVRASLTAGGALLLISALGRFSMASRFLFEPFGFIGQLIFWTLPITFLTAWAAQWRGTWDYFAVAFGLLLVPMLCLAGRSMELVKTLVPEIYMIGKVVAFFSTHNHLGTAGLKKILAMLSTPKGRR